MVCQSPCSTGPSKSVLNRLPLLSIATAMRFPSFGKRIVTFAGSGVSCDTTNSSMTSMLGWSNSDQSSILIDSNFVPPCAPAVEGKSINPKSRVNISHLGMSDLQENLLQPLSPVGPVG